MAQKLIVDFRGVDSGGGGNDRVPEGDYHAVVDEVKVGTAKSSGNTMLVWTFKINQGKQKGKKLKDYTSLNAEALWKLKGLLESLGVKVPDSRTDLQPTLRKLLGKECGITVSDEEWTRDDGKSRMTSKITDYMDLDVLDEDTDEEEEDEEEDEEEQPKPKAKKKKKKKKEEDDEEIEDLDLDEL